MKKSVLSLVFVFIIAAAASAQSLSVGQTLNDFSMSDLNGKVQTLDSVKGTNGTVFIFVSSQCPVVRAYNDRMNALVSDYKAKGINVVGINSNSTETLAQIKSHAAATYTFPVLIDSGNAFADRLGAQSTPEVFLFNSKNVLVYHGAIDNDKSAANITKSYLRAAFDALLSGNAIATANTAAFGCSIKRVE